MKESLEKRIAALKLATTLESSRFLHIVDPMALKSGFMTSQCYLSYVSKTASFLFNATKNITTVVVNHCRPGTSDMSRFEWSWTQVPEKKTFLAMDKAAVETGEIKSIAERRRERVVRPENEKAKIQEQYKDHKIEVDPTKLLPPTEIKSGDYVAKVDLSQQFPAHQNPDTLKQQSESQSTSQSQGSSQSESETRKQ